MSLSHAPDHVTGQRYMDRLKPGPSSFRRPTSAFGGPWVAGRVLPVLGPLGDPVLVRIFTYSRMAAAATFPRRAPSVRSGNIANEWWSDV